MGCACRHYYAFTRFIYENSEACVLAFVNLDWIYNSPVFVFCYVPVATSSTSKIKGCLKTAPNEDLLPARCHGTVISGLLHVITLQSFGVLQTYIDSFQTLNIIWDIFKAHKMSLRKFPHCSVATQQLISAFSPILDRLMSLSNLFISWLHLEILPVALTLWSICFRGLYGLEAWYTFWKQPCKVHNFVN